VSGFVDVVNVAQRASTWGFAYYRFKAFGCLPLNGVLISTKKLSLLVPFLTLMA